MGNQPTSHACLPSRHSALRLESHSSAVYKERTSIKCRYCVYWSVEGRKGIFVTRDRSPYFPWIKRIDNVFLMQRDSQIIVFCMCETRNKIIIHAVTRPEPLFSPCLPFSWLWKDYFNLRDQTPLPFSTIFEHRRVGEEESTLCARNYVHSVFYFKPSGEKF